MADARRRAIAVRPAPRRAGRHRHRQDARLPRAGDRVRGAGRRRHGDEGAAGPAGRQGPAVPRPALARRVRLGRAQGPQQLRLPAAPARAGRRRRRRAASSSWRAWRRRRSTRSPHRRVGRAHRHRRQRRADWAPSDATWRAVSVGSDECPGADRCPLGEPCFAEQARRRAQAADVVVVNTHLYGLDVGSGGVILPEHDVVVFDEAHVLEDVMSDTVGVQIAPGRFVTLGGIGAPHPRRPGADRRAPRPRRRRSARRCDRTPASACRCPIPTTCTRRSSRPASASTGCRPRSRRSTTPVEDAKQRKLRAQIMTGRAIEHLDLALGDRTTATSTSSPARPTTRGWRSPRSTSGRSCATASGTSARPCSPAPPSRRRCVARVGLPPERTDAADVGSPFDYAHHALLYCALHLPDPRSERYRDAVHDELAALITAAGGRTLALFTSWKAMDLAAAALRGPRRHADPHPARPAQAGARRALRGRRGDVRVRHRRLLPGRRRARADAEPGRHRPPPVPPAGRPAAVGPAGAARRHAPSREIDLPRAAMLLAQASGRLIRTATDRGVVAVLDRRLGTAGYRWDIVRALPPMRRTRDRAEVEAFLAGRRWGKGHLSDVECRRRPWRRELGYEPSHARRHERCGPPAAALRAIGCRRGPSSSTTGARPTVAGRGCSAPGSAVAVAGGVARLPAGERTAVDRRHVGRHGSSGSSTRGQRAR